jgi:hypothetical protein
VLVLAALPLLDVDDVASGLGWELVTGVGVATWIAHLYAEVVGDRLRAEEVDRREVRHAMADGLPILVAALPPAFMLLLGRLDVVDEDVALWAAIIAAIVQLVAVGAYVGRVLSPKTSKPWSYAAATAAVGVAVVTVKLVLSH